MQAAQLPPGSAEPLAMPSAPEVVKATLAPQVSALTSRATTLRQAIDTAKASLTLAEKEESTLKAQALLAWAKVRTYTRILDVLGGVLPTLLCCFVMLALRLTLNSPLIYLVGIPTALVLTYGLSRLISMHLLFIAITLALMIVSLKLFIPLAIVASLLAAHSRRAKPGLLGLIDPTLPDDGLFGIMPKGTFLYVPGLPGVAMPGVQVKDKQQCLLFRVNGLIIAWYSPPNQSDFFTDALPFHKVLPLIVSRMPALVSWALRDTQAPSRAARSLMHRTAELEEVHKQLAALDTQAEAWEGLALPEDTLRSLASSASLISAKSPLAPTGILLYGPAGTGKTEIGQRLARAGGLNFIATSAPALKGEFIGGTERAVQNLFKEARAQAPCLIFVDECDACLPDRSSTADAFAKSITESFLTHWQGFQGSEGICVVGATNHRERLDTAIMSRFSDALEIGPPDASARAQILSHAFIKAEITSPPPLALVKQTAGSTGRDLVNLARSLQREMISQGSTTLTEEIITATLSKQRARGSTAVDTSATWNTLVLPEQVLKDLQTVTRMLSNSDALQAQGISVPRGILLEGPPGTGKTQIARTMANESGLSFIPLSNTDLKGAYVGQTANMVKTAINRARSQAPAIVFLDEIETMAPSRGTGDQFTQDLIGQLLQELDGAIRDTRPIFFIAATNRIDVLDSAIRSRFPRTILIALPDLAARTRLFAIRLGKVKNVDGDRNLLSSTMAQATAGYSGRDIMSLVEQATIQAFNHASDSDNVILCMDDLTEALALSRV